MSSIDHLQRLFDAPDPDAPVVVLSPGAVKATAQRRDLIRRLREVFRTSDEGLAASVDLALHAANDPEFSGTTIVARAGERPFLCGVPVRAPAGVYVGPELPAWLSDRRGRSFAA